MKMCTFSLLLCLFQLTLDTYRVFCGTSTKRSTFIKLTDGLPVLIVSMVKINNYCDVTTSTPVSSMIRLKLCIRLQGGSFTHPKYLFASKQPDHYKINNSHFWHLGVIVFFFSFTRLFSGVGKVGKIHFILWVYCVFMFLLNEQEFRHL